ncbi:alpha/beta fold hydrolase [Sessilibacter corallicola]|uniref:alpha/beta fold hydrolase n=1 Tax=Sessilibacter corallicola TaxID=2904075 RepID=UPI001E426AC1|nr:alpha/beta hydrolase [Sessilibacter corallicola]MCE2029686.1 alpha/beta hydrolase [Sessilibacter corallicola]
MVIHGDDDEYGSIAFPEFISSRTNGEASMLIIEECGHVPHREKPKELIRAVKRFVNKQAL